MPDVQYTIRRVPRELDKALRKKAAKRGISLNQLVLEELEGATGAPGPAVRRDLSDLAGKWQDDPEFDRILAEQRAIDWEKWR